LAPVNGESIAGWTPDVLSAAIDDAASIMADRLEAAGITGADVVRQGESDIAVTLSGPAYPGIVDLLTKPAVMRFRPVLAQAIGSPFPDATSAPSMQPDRPAKTPQDPSDFAWITAQVEADFDALSCNWTSDTIAMGPGRGNLVFTGTDDPTQPLVTCSDDANSPFKFILGPAEIDSTMIASASADLLSGQSGSSTDQWGITITFDDEGTQALAGMSQRLYSFGMGDPRKQAAIVLDGIVISAPAMNGVVTNGVATVFGGLKEATATTLANQLNSRALPMPFEVVSNAPAKG
jgi:preprotein translocase subunit SecD